MLRYPSYTGSFYSSDKEDLKKLLNAVFNNSRRVENLPGRVKAIIVPHAGVIFSGPIAATAFKIIDPKLYKNFFIIGPSHYAYFSDIYSSSFDYWQTPLGDAKVSKLNFNTQFLKDFPRFDDAHLPEHCIEVQLPLLQFVLKKFQFIPLLTGNVVDYEKCATMINKYLRADDLLIISSDFSHFLPHDKATEKDKNTIKKILELNPVISHEEACGADGINILIHLAKNNNWKPVLLDYRNSGDTAGTKESVVGYAAIAFVS